MPLKKGLNGKSKQKRKAKSRVRNPTSSHIPHKKKRKTASDAEDEFSSGSSISGGSLHASDSEPELGSWNTTDQVSAFAQPIYEAGQEFEVDAVLRWRRHPRKGYLQYRTAWTGFPVYDTTWEPEHMFEDRQVISRFWEQQGGRPDDVPPAPDSDEEPPVLDPGEETESLKLYKGPKGREARRKLREEYRRDKLQLRKHWQKRRREQAQAEDSTSDLSDASATPILKRKRNPRLAVSDEEEEEGWSPRRIVGYPNGKKQAWSADNEGAEYALAEKGDRALSSVAATAQEGTETAEGDATSLQLHTREPEVTNSRPDNSRTAPSSEPLIASSQFSRLSSGSLFASTQPSTTTSSDASSSDSTDSKITVPTLARSEGPRAAAPASMYLPPPPTQSSGLGSNAAIIPVRGPTATSNRLQDGAHIHATKLPVQAPSVPPPAKKRDRPLATASVARIQRQMQTQDSQGKTMSSGSITQGKRRLADVPMSNATSSILTSASGTRPTQGNSAGGLLEMIVGPVTARPSIAQSANAMSARSSGATSSARAGGPSVPTESAAAKGSFRGAHKTSSRISILSEAPPTPLITTGPRALRRERGPAFIPASVGLGVAASPSASADQGLGAGTPHVTLPVASPSARPVSPGHQEQATSAGQGERDSTSTKRTTLPPTYPVPDIQRKTMVESKSAPASDGVSRRTHLATGANSIGIVSTVSGSRFSPGIERHASFEPIKTAATTEKSGFAQSAPPAPPERSGSACDPAQSAARNDRDYGASSQHWSGGGTSFSRLQAGVADLADRHTPPWNRQSYKRWREDPSRQNPYAQSYHAHEPSSMQAQQRQAEEPGHHASQRREMPSVSSYQRQLHPESSLLAFPAPTSTPATTMQARPAVPQDPRRAKLTGAMSGSSGSVLCNPHPSAENPSSHSTHTVPCPTSASEKAPDAVLAPGRGRSDELDQ